MVQWSEKWQMKFNVEKCKSYALGEKEFGRGVRDERGCAGDCGGGERSWG